MTMYIRPRIYKQAGVPYLSSGTVRGARVLPPIRVSPAVASRELNVPQVFTKLGEPIPIVFARFRNNKGGILLAPTATEARFEYVDPFLVTAYYHVVISEGQVDALQVRDVLQGSLREGTHTQTYNRRAGTWTPGNVTNTPGLLAPLSCGTIGSYPGLSTLSFTNTVYISSHWKWQVHLFIRGGLNVTRLVDSVLGPSDNYADLVKWLFENTARIPSELIYTAGFVTAATFLEYNGLTCNGQMNESGNLPAFLAEWNPYFLLADGSYNGQKYLRPLLPTLASGAINTGAIAAEYTFTEDTVLLDTFEIEYIPYTERQPFVVQVTWRQQLEGDIGIIRTHERRYAGTALNGPYESHDLSRFCTNEDHAAKVAAYILAKRIYPTHTVRFTARPQAHNTVLSAGSIIRVRLERNATNYASSFHDYLYQVLTITETLSGEVSYEAIHFPIDSQGRSLIALDVAAAVGSGVLLTNNRTGPAVGTNSPTNTTVPPETGTTPTSEIDPVVEDTPSGDPGTGGFGDTPPSDPIAFVDDNRDTDAPVISMGVLAGLYGDPLTASNVDGGDIQWQSDGVAIPGATSTTFVPRPQDIGTSITLQLTRPNGEITVSNAIPIYGINPIFPDNGGIYATVTVETFGRVTQTDCASGAVTTNVDPDYVFTEGVSNAVEIWTATSGDTGNTFFLDGVLQYAKACGRPYVIARRNGYLRHLRTNGAVYNDGLWGGNVGMFSQNSYNSIHGSVITSVVLTQNHPTYGNIGDEVLVVGQTAAKLNGNTYWSRGYSNL